jgi:4'-phosphopantetheinyl transferase
MYNRRCAAMNSQSAHRAITDGCELWIVKTADVGAPSLVAARNTLLVGTENEQMSRFVFERRRHEYLVTRALAQWVLARWTGRRPGDVPFRRSEYGRPVLDLSSNVHFNLTNTEDLVACLVTSGREVGVDAEPLSRADDILRIAESVFAPREREMLVQLAAPNRHRRAVELWTCKEAYMKARGLGLSLPPDQFQVDHRDGKPVLSLGEVDDDGARWELNTYAIDGHLVSTCIERVGSGPCALELRRTNLEELASPER